MPDIFTVVRMSLPLDITAEWLQTCAETYFSPVTLILVHFKHKTLFLFEKNVSIWEAISLSLNILIISHKKSKDACFVRIRVTVIIESILHWTVQWQSIYRILYPEQYSDSQTTEYCTLNSTVTVIIKDTVQWIVEWHSHDLSSNSSLVLFPDWPNSPVPAGCSSAGYRPLQATKSAFQAVFSC